MDKRRIFAHNTFYFVKKNDHVCTFELRNNRSFQVKDDEEKYKGLRVSYLHSSIFLAPKCHCDPNAYFYDDDLAKKTVVAHKWINSDLADKGCEDKTAKYEKGIR